MNDNEKFTIKARELAKIVEPLRKEQVGRPTDMINAWLARNKYRGIVAIGENGHDEEGALKLQNNIVDGIRGRIARVFLEEDEGRMPEVKQLYETGKMPSSLQEYLRKGFVRVDIMDQPYKVNLVNKCRQREIPVQFIDQNSLSFGRDADWFRKITSVIGPKVNGTYVLIAGRSHIQRTELNVMHLVNPVVKLLEACYPGKVLSTLAMNIETLPTMGNLDKFEIVKPRFIRDLYKLNMHRSDAAVWTKQSPYEGRLMAAYNPTIANAFDLLMATPGRNLNKHSS